VHHSKFGLPMSEMGQKPALSRRSIAVRFAPNKQTPTERVQSDAMCHKDTYTVQAKIPFAVGTRVTSRAPAQVAPERNTIDCDLNITVTMKVGHSSRS
jgi:hypothetical protein